MKRFKEISKKIVSIKTFAKRNFLDDEDKGEGASSKPAAKRSRETLLMEVTSLLFCCRAGVVDTLFSMLY
jgi:hypothetical protein